MYKAKKTPFLSDSRTLAVMFLFAILTVGCKSTQTMVIEQYRALAEQGGADAQVALGGCYLTGSDVVAPDTVQVLYWLRKAAEQEETHAQMFLQELGVE